MKQPRQQPQPNRTGKAMGCGCLGILALLVIGAIGSTLDSGADSNTDSGASAKTSSCPTITLKGMPATRQQVTVATAGKATCDDGARELPFTATSAAGKPLAVTLTLRLTAPTAATSKEPVFIHVDVPAGGTAKATANVLPWGHIDGAAKLTATVTEFTVGQPNPDPTGNTDVHGPNLHRPHRCHHKWYC